MFMKQSSFSGAYGIVYAGNYHNNEVVVKRILIEHVERREIDVQTQLHHENVVKIITVEDDIDFR